MMARQPCFWVNPSLKIMVVTAQLQRDSIPVFQNTNHTNLDDGGINETILCNQVLLIILRLKLSPIEILHPDWRNPPKFNIVHPC